MLEACERLARGKGDKPATSGSLHSKQYCILKGCQPRLPTSTTLACFRHLGATKPSNLGYPYSTCLPVEKLQGANIGFRLILPTKCFGKMALKVARIILIRILWWFRKGCRMRINNPRYPLHQTYFSLVLSLYSKRVITNLFAF